MNAYGIIRGWFDLPPEVALILLCSAKSGLILAIGYVGALCVPGTMPARRQLVLRLALLAAAVLPVLTWVMPSWYVTLPSQMAAGWQGGRSVADVSSPAGDGAVVSSVTGLALFAWCLGLFLVGATVVLIRIIFGVAAASRILRSAKPCDDAHTLLLVGRLKGELGMQDDVRVLMSPTVATPVALSLPRATVVLPSTATSWSRNDLCLAVLHELVHVKRRDDLWNIVGSGAALFNWFNPFVWAVRKRLAVETEKACDDAVLWFGAEAESYARFLLTMVRNSRSRPADVVLGAGVIGKQQLEERVMSILSDRIRIPGMKRTATRLSLILTLAVVTPLAVLQLTTAGVNAQAAGDKSVASGAIASQGGVVDTGNQATFPGPDEFVKVDSVPEMIYYENPVYPDSAQKAGIEGTAWVKSLVDTDGSVAKAMIAKSSGSKILDDAALAVAVKNKFKPALRDGKKVATWVSYKVEFVLEAKIDDKAGK